MRLEKLEIHGFKSFADKVEFQFKPGMTAFVGPNGCGKSNVVDAVKWVLGEQSVKALRGNEMLDVIFNGTPSRRSRGYAEATLTLSNTKGLLPTEFEEVGVTRRLYRSGESEYYINKQRCRLRDIRDLFMDTGIGMDAYSVIEQGKVDVLLTSNKADRRAIFEEAAGISKYKSQKRTCLLKLERVTNNLLRLGDIIDEVEKRMRSVNYQAAKARRWKRLDDERRELAIALALHNYGKLLGEQQAAARETGDLSSEVERLSAAAERLEAELSALETGLTDAEHAIGELRSEEVRITSQLEAAEQAVKMNERRMSEQDDLEAASKAEIAKAEASIEMMRAELEQSRGEVEQLTTAIEAARADLTQRREAVRGIEERVRAARTKIDQQRGRSVELAGERARCNNEITAIASQCEQLDRQDQRLAGRTAEFRGGLAEAQDRRRQVRTRHDALQTRAARLQTERAAAQREQDAARAELNDLTERINANRAEQAAVGSRLEVLRDLEDKQDGVGEGVRALREAMNSGDGSVSGLCGTVADVLEVDVAHAGAIEAALGMHAQAIVTETSDAAHEAMRYLAGAGRGRAAFLPLTVPNGRPELSAPPEAVGRAVDLVRCSARYEPAIHHLLGDVCVVADLDAARRLAEANGRVARYATLDGHLLDPRGVSVGGSAQGATGLISRRSELRMLDVKQGTLEADWSVLSTQRNEVATRLTQTEERIRRIDADAERARSEAAGLAADLGNLGQQIERLEAEIETHESERAEIAGNIEQLGRREREARQESARLERVEQELKESLAEQEVLLHQAESERDKLRETIAQLDVAQAQRTEKAGSLKRRVGELDHLIGERQSSLSAARQQIDVCVRRRMEAYNAMLAKRGEIQSLLERRGEVGKARAEAEQQLAVVRDNFTAKRDERNQSARRAKEAEARLNDLNVRATKIAMRMENLEGRAESEFEASLAEMHASAAIEERDWDAVAGEIEEIERKIRSMGSVNTYAIEELEELEKRAAELRAQRDDLQKAEGTLREIIRKINRKSREMFRETFDAVRENFQTIFRKLFGGGRADIVLEEDVDILDAGVDVIACPPGKEPASISLLSGGEKTMTAIALLFAVFRSKPSPFCILDEVDAALDESNIERFCLMVREFLEGSQFLVVTHSRSTMAMADVLYGITMQEPGVSTKVEVRFNDEVEPMVAGG
jgi:chromosome segregation protein